MVDVVQETIKLKKWQQECDDEIKKRELDLRASEMQQQQMFQQSLAAAAPIPTTTTGIEHVYDVCSYRATKGC